MDYNPLPDLLIMGAMIAVLVAFIKLAGQPKRGATPADDKSILRHQNKRRGWMLANGGLPVELGRIER